MGQAPAHGLESRGRALQEVPAIQGALPCPLLLVHSPVHPKPPQENPHASTPPTQNQTTMLGDPADAEVLKEQSR